jgi:hypothetical protein
LSRQDVLDGYEAMYGGDGKGKWPMHVRAVEETVVDKELPKARNRVVDGNSNTTVDSG